MAEGQLGARVEKAKQRTEFQLVREQPERAAGGRPRFVRMSPILQPVVLHGRLNSAED